MAMIDFCIFFFFLGGGGGGEGEWALTGDRFPIMRNAVSVESNRNAIRLA